MFIAYHLSYFRNVCLVLFFIGTTLCVCFPCVCVCVTMLSLRVIVVVVYAPVLNTSFPTNCRDVYCDVSQSLLGVVLALMCMYVAMVQIFSGVANGHTFIFQTCHYCEEKIFTGCFDTIFLFCVKAVCLQRVGGGAWFLLHSRFIDHNQFYMKIVSYSFLSVLIINTDIHLHVNAATSVILRFQLITNLCVVKRNAKKYLGLLYVMVSINYFLYVSFIIVFYSVGTIEYSFLFSIR